MPSIAVNRNQKSQKSSENDSVAHHLSDNEPKVILPIETESPALKAIIKGRRQKSQQIFTQRFQAAVKDKHMLDKASKNLNGIADRLERMTEIADNSKTQSTRGYQRDAFQGEIGFLLREINDIAHGELSAITDIANAEGYSDVTFEQKGQELWGVRKMLEKSFRDPLDMIQLGIHDLSVRKGDDVQDTQDRANIVKDHILGLSSRISGIQQNLEHYKTSVQRRISGGLEGSVLVSQGVSAKSAADQMAKSAAEKIFDTEDPVSIHSIKNPFIAL